MQKTIANLWDRVPGISTTGRIRNFRPPSIFAPLADSRISSDRSREPLFLMALTSKLVSVSLIWGIRPARLAINLAMAPRGELGLIFAERGRSSGILNFGVYVVVAIAIAMTMLPVRMAVKWL